MNPSKVTQLGAFFEVSGVYVHTGRVSIGSTEGVTRVMEISKALDQPLEIEGEFGLVDYTLPETPLEGMRFNRVSTVLIVPGNDHHLSFHTHIMLIKTEAMGNFLWNLFSPGKAPWLP